MSYTINDANIDQYEMNTDKQVLSHQMEKLTNINDVWFRVDKANIIDLNQVEISEDSFIKFINNSRFYKANSKLIAFNLKFRGKKGDKYAR